MNTYFKIPKAYCALSMLLCALILRCASPQTSDVLEPVKETESEPMAQEGASAGFLELEQILKNQGYEPIGIQFETPQTLEILKRVFSDPKTHQRNLKFIYTGLQMSYDKAAESLTVGGLNNPIAIVQYIAKNVPLRFAHETGKLPPLQQKKQVAPNRVVPRTVKKPAVVPTESAAPRRAPVRRPRPTSLPENPVPKEFDIEKDPPPVAPPPMPSAPPAPAEGEAQEAPPDESGFLAPVPESTIAPE